MTNGDLIPAMTTLILDHIHDINYDFLWTFKKESVSQILFELGPKSTLINLSSK